MVVPDSSPALAAGRAPNADSTSDPVARALELVAARVGEGALGGSGELILAHARGTLGILSALNVDADTRVAAILFGAGDLLRLDEIEALHGAEVRVLVDGMRQLLRLKDLTLRVNESSSGAQLETLRRMTLAMASDIRVVLLRLASRLQSLRWHAESRRPPEPAIAHETLEVLAPLANRLGLGQLKWEMEDLAFRFLEPELYRSIAQQLEERRAERESFVRGAVARLSAELARQGLYAEVTGRPKHIRSIYNKMRTKGLTFSEVQDLRAFRVLVSDVKDCYAVLGLVHQIWPPVPREFDDYISRPKPNGYRSLHTVVIAEDGRPLEVQIRTHEMHRHAEFGIASHWRYKEGAAGLSGSPAAEGRRREGRGESSAGPSVGDSHDQRVEWLRQLLMWQQEVGTTLGGRMPISAVGVAERIYLLTPQARVVELPMGSTPIDFAYHVHTGLGHRCRGARVDGQMVPLNTPLRSGQTVEIVAVRAGSGSAGPSRDWLNPQLGYVRSPRARTKVRQWFNALELERDMAGGRDKVEKVLQREGRTALSYDELARRLGFPKPEDLFVAVARDEVGPRMLEEGVRATPEGGRCALDVGKGVAAPESVVSVPELAPGATSRAARAEPPAGGVLVVGVDFLMTQLARCCRPAPPDPIVGFVTRGRGVSVHRAECRSFAEMARRAPERVLETSWGDWRTRREPPRRGEAAPTYPVDIVLRARDRQGLLRDVSDVFARDRLNVTAVQTMSRGGSAQMQFTVEVPDIPRLERTLAAVRDVEGVVECRRR
ncbi:MAG: RelA/SpoT family protein [Burkholderiales bacterium]|jgi:GTP pyrophosphokinase|nr:bifunctional (p)ppGpp synthetase/guanosine-3',5'-bis(diphosphate) 3'-pyrophosphohydrolase [Burkholderiales bacterium]